VEELVISQGEKEGQTEVYLAFNTMLLGLGRRQVMPGLVSIEQDGAVQGGCWRLATEDAGVQGGF